MSYEQNIRNAGSLPEALAIVGQGLDRIEALYAPILEQMAHPRVIVPADPWAEWGEPVKDFAGFVEENTPHVQAEANAVAAEALEAQIAAETDPDELRALTARLRLLKDDGQALESPVQQGRRAVITSDGTNGQVDLVPVSEERKQARRDWAVVNKLDEYIPLDIETAAAAFAKGGPEWLVDGNRDAVMQMPFAARQWLVLDLMQDSQAAAQEIGRDILKSEESTDKNITLDAIDAMSGR